MFAQSIGEYGALSSLVAGVGGLVGSVIDWVGSLSPVTWVLGVVAVIVLAVWRRR